MPGREGKGMGNGSRSKRTLHPHLHKVMMIRIMTRIEIKAQLK